MEAVSRTQNKQGKLWKSIKEHKTLYLLMLPGLLYFVLFRYLPMFGLVLLLKIIISLKESGPVTG